VAAQDIGPVGRLLAAVPRIRGLAAGAIVGWAWTLALPGALFGSVDAGTLLASVGSAAAASSGACLGTWASG
jgi:hypothetical protein